MRHFITKYHVFYNKNIDLLYIKDKPHAVRNYNFANCAFTVYGYSYFLGFKVEAKLIWEG